MTHQSRATGEDLHAIPLAVISSSRLAGAGVGWGGGCWFFKDATLRLEKRCYKTKKQQRNASMDTVHLESPDPGVAVVDGGGQQGLPALRVVLVGQLSGAQFDVQNAVSAQDGPEGAEGDVGKVKPRLLHQPEKVYGRCPPPCDITKGHNHIV